MDINDIKIKRGRERTKKIKLGGKKQRKQRSGSEKRGRHRLGNSINGHFCSHCMPTLRNSIDRRYYIHMNMKHCLDEFSCDF